MCLVMRTSRTRFSEMNDSLATIGEHLEALRSVLLRIVLIVGLGMLISLCFFTHVLSLITYPLEGLQNTSHELQRQTVVRQHITNTGSIAQSVPLETGTQLLEPTRSVLLAPGESVTLDTVVSSSPLVILGPVEGFRTVLSVCFWFSLVVTAPLWLYVICLFIAPGLHAREHSFLIPCTLIALLFMGLGIAFGFYVALPTANAFLYAFNSQIGSNLWSLGTYYDYTVALLLANAFAFELGAVLALLVHYGGISSNWMKQWRRHVWVGVLVLGALLTPPDVVTQLLLAGPLLVLFELILLYARIKEARDVDAVGSQPS